MARSGRPSAARPPATSFVITAVDAGSSETADGVGIVDGPRVEQHAGGVSRRDRRLQMRVEVAPIGVQPAVTPFLGVGDRPNRVVAVSSQPVVIDGSMARR